MQGDKKHSASCNTKNSIAPGNVQIEMLAADTKSCWIPWWCDTYFEGKNIVLYCTQCTEHNSEQSWAVAKTVASKSKGKICIACCPVAIHMYCKQWGNKVFGAKCLKCLVFCTVTEALTYCHVVARLSVTRPAQLLGWRLNHDATTGCFITGQAWTEWKVPVIRPLMNCLLLHDSQTLGINELPAAPWYLDN